MLPNNIIIRFLVLATTVTLPFFTTGCYGSKEMDDVAYVVVVGIDKVEGNKEKITYQIALPSGKGNNESTNEQDTPQAPGIINSIITPTYSKVRMLLNATMSRSPNLSHITAYIISEEKARDGLNTRMSYFVRNRDFRDSIFLIIVEGTAEDYIKQNVPRLEDQIHKFYESQLASDKNSGYFLRTNLHDFYVRLKNPGGSAYAVYSGINPKNSEDKPAGSKMPEQKGTPYLPSGIPRTGTSNPAEFFGIAVFRQDKLVGVLNSDETRAVAILQGKFVRSYVGVVDPLMPKKDAINLNVYSYGKPKITASLTGEKTLFNVDVNLEAELQAVTSGINYEAPEYRQLLEAQIANLFKEQIAIMLEHTQRLGTDPVGFGLYLRPKFPSTAEMDQENLTALYQAADIQINVTAKVRRTGLIWRSSPE